MRWSQRGLFRLAFLNSNCYPPPGRQDISRSSVATFVPGAQLLDHPSLLGTGDPSSIFRWSHSLESEARYRLRTNTPSRATFDQKHTRMACLRRLVLCTVPTMASMLRSRRSEKTMMPIASGDFKLWKFFCSPSKGNRLSEVSSGKLIFSLFQLACNKVSGILDTKTSSNLERGESGFLFGEGRGCFER